MDQKQEQLDAFNELQNYADFQYALSGKVLNDVSREDTSSATREPFLPLQDTTSYAPQGMIGSPATREPFLPLQDTTSYAPQGMTGSPALQRGQLRWPIIIPQKDTLNGDSRWIRAYPRPLMNCGIDQQTFLNFLDSFEVHIKVVTTLATYLTGPTDLYPSSRLVWKLSILQAVHLELDGVMHLRLSRQPSPQQSK